MKVKAVGYARISKDAQSSQSIEVQKKAILDYCQYKELELVDLIEEVGVSASIPFKERLGGSKALSYLSKGEATCLVGHKLDRLFRGLSDCSKNVEELSSENKALHVVDVGGVSIDTSSGMGEGILGLMGALANLERITLRERTKASLQHKKEKGERVGSIPYGFGLDPQNSKMLEKDAEEQKIIKKVLSLRKKGLSSRKISKELEKKGLFSRSGKPFYSTQILRIIKDNQS